MASATKKTETALSLKKQKAKKPAVVKSKTVPQKKQKVETKKKGSHKVTIAEVRQKSSKVAISNNCEKKPVSRVLAKRPSVAVAVPSPFRFPAVRQVSLTTFARVMGMFFIVLGSFFTLANLEFAGQSFALFNQPQQASVIDSKESTVASSIRIESADEHHKTIYVIVSNARSVTLLGEHLDLGLTTILGSAKMIDANTWQYDWNTESIENGTYILSAVVVGEVENFEVKSSEEQLIQRATPPVSEEVDTDTEVTSEAEVESTETLQASQSELLEPLEIEPQLSFSLTPESRLSGLVEIASDAKDIDKLEVYAIPKHSISPRYIGRASYKDDVWKYLWNTTESPNGSYDIFLKAKNKYGYTESERVSVSILNKIPAALTPEYEAKLSAITELQTKLYKAESDSEQMTLFEDEMLNDSPVLIYVESIDRFVDSFSESEFASSTDTIASVLYVYDDQMNAALKQYTTALRENDTDTATRVLIGLENIRGGVRSELARTFSEEILTKVDVFISKYTFDHKDIVERNVKVAQTHLGEDAFTDSDLDGLLDIDEVYVYDTNPFVADTDADGYVDGAEINDGYNPQNPQTEAYVLHSSAKDIEPIRSDAFVVDSVTTIGSSVEPKMLISGTGLPHSYVTLSVFSSPFTVTTKTDENGSWNYILDKALEIGIHEVYAGSTDNAGNVVAQSNPYTFSMTKDGLENAPAVLKAPEESIAYSSDSRTPLVAASLAVVALGLVLLLLSAYASILKRKETIVSPA